MVLVALSGLGRYDVDCIKIRLFHLKYSNTTSSAQQKSLSDYSFMIANSETYVPGFDIRKLTRV